MLRTESAWRSGPSDMVRKNSDYRHSYRGSDINELRRRWHKNSHYRDLRRQSEHCHTPLGWQDGEEWVDIEDDISEPSTGRRPMSVPIHKYKHEKYNKAYQDRMRNYVDAKFSQMSLRDDGYESVSASPSPETAWEEKVKPDSYIGKTMRMNKTTNVNDLDSSGELKQKYDARSSEKKKAQALNKTYTRQQQDVQSHEQRTTRPRKPVNKKPIPRARPVSAPMDRSMIRSHIQPPINHKIEPDFIGEQSPFVTYGAHNEKLVTGTKKTHNIRASAEIHPSAVRASRRRQLLMEEAERELRSASQIESQKRALYSYLTRKDNSDWDTEYRRSYVNYDKALYKKNLAQRFDPKLAYEAYTVP